ncbi:DUF7504 family protein [Halalkalicoccus jeotgali]|uniref:Uncharacterized protein n=1 Tax=Halalkalicoccus jeotgali (strain DSM 18796 / CECT 7217 / JCM 14584 / KCTC 4019 / B3) TaxID=795797 RepID=D8J934_HALJB|nr:hypothetical protein [Halalkalicoccus jeotgali]ADJ16303.1 hypothetical protein HacjB3_14610 [Halalkalicoccus jeotgali B3]ELY37037.1 hypothetical protein C497_09848 [Halalkalicoccus jeotgali B3]
MPREHGADGSAYEETTALVQELDALKQHGSNLLVVGSRMPDAHEAACRQFLGETSAQARRRLFVRADPCGPDPTRLSAGCEDPSRCSVVRYEATSRSVSSDSSSPFPESVPERSVEEGLGSLGLAISEAITEFEATSSGLSAAELRLCFDSLTPLVSEYDPESLFRFLHLLTHRVRSVDGMAHYHLTTERSNRTVALLEPLFDAVIELCLRGDTLYQRWYLRDSGMTTGWLQL